MKNPVNARFKCWDSGPLFSTFFPLFISGISGQSPETDMLRRFSVKSVHSPFLVLDYHFLLPSSIRCWHLLWHNTSGSESLAEGLWAGTVQGTFVCWQNSIRWIQLSQPGNPIPWAPPSQSLQEVHPLLSASLKASSLTSTALYQFRFWGFNISPLD